ncbi:unnamed protein product, partial [Darwinula stevensoni]
MVAEFAGAKYGIAAMNGTAALHIAQELAGVRQRDYVITPDITFIATANAIKYTGADPIFIDVDKDTWQMDLDILEAFLEKDTFYYKDHTYLKSDKRCGGGVIVTDDENLAKKAKHITTQAKTDTFEYDHDEIGYNYRLVNILAAV